MIRPMDVVVCAVVAVSASGAAETRSPAPATLFSIIETRSIVQNMNNCSTGDMDLSI
jgi:hypothetical protein